MARASKKNLILKSAKRLFAERGYDATGMEEIAKESGIPKSLIYYHFKNKEELLNTIISNFIDEYSQILSNKTHGIEKISVYIEFLKENRDCAKIIVSESLKSNSRQNLFFKTLTPLMKIDSEQPTNDKMDNFHWITEFFTSIIPSVLFVCYEDSWCDYFDISAEQMEADFFNAYKLTHGAYHKQMNKESL